MDFNWSDILVVLSVLLAVIQIPAVPRRSARISALQRDEVVDSDTNGGGVDADMEVDYDFGNDDDDIESQQVGVSLLCIFCN